MKRWAVACQVNLLLSEYHTDYISLSQKISNIRAELERAAPSSSSSEEWSAAAELAEVEKLAAMGIVLRPRTDPSSSTSGAARARKTLAKENPDGHVLFAEDKEECEYGVIILWTGTECVKHYHHSIRVMLMIQYSPILWKGKI